MTTLRGPGLATLAALLVAACASAAGGPPGGQTSAPLSPSAPEVASASAPAVTVIDDPALSIELPPGWREMALTQVRERAVEGSSSDIPGIRKANEQLIRDIDSNVIRLAAIGASGLPPWNGTMLIELPSATSIEEQIDRIAELQAALAKPTSSERTDVTLLIGSGVRLSAAADPPPQAGGMAVAARAINYVIELDDGRILWINATGPEASPTFVGMIDWSVGQTLRKR